LDVVQGFVSFDNDSSAGHIRDWTLLLIVEINWCESALEEVILCQGNNVGISTAATVWITFRHGSINKSILFMCDTRKTGSIFKDLGLARPDDHG